MLQHYPIAKELVLVGGGHSHVIVLRMLAMRPIPGLQVTLISPDVRTPYSGMLPGVVAGHYTEDDIHIDLVPLCRFAGVRFIRASVKSINTLDHSVGVEGRPDITYDLLSLDIGITPAMDEIAGARDAGIAVKPISDFLSKWHAFLARARAGEISSVGFVGAGAGGIELCLAVQHRLAGEFPERRFLLNLFTDDGVVLPGYPSGVQQKFLRHLGQQGVTIHHDFRVIARQNGDVMSAKGQQFPVDEVFFVTSAAPQAWLRNTGLKLDTRGFIQVRSTLQSVNTPNVFAVGDIAHVLEHPRPKAGVYAVRQGPVLYRNLMRFLDGQAPMKFRPQDTFLSLITTGDRHAVASRHSFSAEGRWVWRWKDWIDRRFMKRFQQLPAMKQVKYTGLLKDFDEQMQCGGCGSKVSADLLHAVLMELGIGGDGLDDAAVYRVPAGKVMLHSVDAFRSFIDDPWLFARIAVNHALSDIYAMGGLPVTAMAVITLPYATPAKTKSLLQQVLGGALTQLSADGVSLVGGHTAQGVELSVGFAVNGIADETSLLRKKGLVEGDALIVTRALGSGALLAGDMQSKARGIWVDGALQQMLQSNRAATEVLAGFRVHAATDITGFGLAGHLSEMLRASGVAASLDLDLIPVLPGALEMLLSGIQSTLHDANKRSTSHLTPSSHPYYEILFDPQTAGGLLIALPAADAAECVAQLRQAGYVDAIQVGRVNGPGLPAISFSPHLP